MNLGLSNGSESEFFITLAAIAATLLGLSYLALNFFINSVFDRYNNFKMPVYSDEERYQRLHKGKWSILFRNMFKRQGTSQALNTSRKIKSGPQFELLDYPDKKQARPDEIERQRSPYDVTDYQLFDGNPLIVFMAFATAVSWNFYLVPLVISLTLISPNLDNLWVIGCELAAFWGTLFFSLLVRHTQYLRLSTYRTRDERLWALGEIIFLVLLAGILLFASDTILTQLCGSQHSGFCLAALAPMQAKQWLLLMLKSLCLISFLLGLYATNKDFFVFFKAKVSNEIRERWLKEFVIKYPHLEEQVKKQVEKLKNTDGRAADDLFSIWNEGAPWPGYIREGFSPYIHLKEKDKNCLKGANGPSSGSTPNKEKICRPDPRWNQLIKGKPTVGAWMFDVPGIAAWEHDIMIRFPEDIQAELNSPQGLSSSISINSSANGQKKSSSEPQSRLVARQTGSPISSIIFILAGLGIGGTFVAFLAKRRGRNIRR